MRPARGAPGLWQALRLFALLTVTPFALAPALASVCSGFRPARLDVRGVPPALARPIAALPADFDGDGVQDVAMVNRYTDGFLTNGSVSILRGDLEGNFTLLYTQICGPGATSAALNDFNKDGRPDIAAVNDTSVMLFFGNGFGGFQSTSTLPMGFNPVYVAIADMDADSKSDLVIVQQYVGQPSGRIVVLRGDGFGGFTSMTPSNVGQSPLGAAIGDFNGDGKLDVVAGSSLSTSITFLPGLGDGNFGTAVSIPIGASAFYLAAADLDADSKLDLVVAGQTVGQHIMILKGMGNGGFSILSSLPDGSDPRTPAISDFNKDGILDVAVPNAGGSNVLLLTGSGGGAFAAPLSLGTDSSPTQASITDVNSDGFMDLLTPNEGSNSLSVLMGGIKGSLGTPTTPTGVVPIGAATADFNHDGEPDLVVVSRDDNAVKVYLGDGEGGLMLAQSLTAGIAPGAVDTADFNMDGWADFAVANQGVAGDQSNDTVSVFFNNGAGGFTLGPTLVAGDLPLDIKAADFNGDGWPDIAVANSRSDKVSFFYSQLFNSFSNVKSIRVGAPQRTLAAGDFTGDGINDLAVGLMGQNSFVVLLGTPSGGFQTGPANVLQGTGILDQLAGIDLNGDLSPDLMAITQPTDPLQPGWLTALIANGEGGIFLAPYPPQATGVRPEAIGVLDLNGDGIQDVVVANRFDNDVLTYSGDGTGQFTPSDRFGTGNDPFYLVPADFNDDGRPDVVAVNSGGNSVAMLLNNNMPMDDAEDFGLTDSTRMAWSPVPGADSYRLYRDLMSNLAPDSFGQCLAINIGTTEFFDGGVPPVNGIYFYLLTVVTAGHEGPLGFGSTCQKRPNFHPCSAF